jgi:L-fucose isomerase-like protein
MATQSSVKVGLVPISKFIFDREAARRQKSLIEARLKSWGVDYVGIDGITDDGMIYKMQDIDPVVRHLKDSGVGAVFAPHCNFGTEGLVGLLGKKLGLPFLLWGPQDDPPRADGSRDRDTLCGLLASSKVLGKLGVPFTYIENCPVDDPAFERGFSRFLGAASVATALRTLRIGQIGPRVDFFFTTIVNESVLLERFGVEIVPRDLAGIVAATRGRVAKEERRYQEEARQLKRDFDLEGFRNDEQLYVLFALRDEILEFVGANGLTGIAIQNIQSLVYELGVDQAWVYAVLNDMGIPVGTETDIHGVISSVLLQAATLGKEPTFLTDITIRHPGDPNGVLLWHTSWPPSLADPAVRPKLGRHWLWRSEYPGMSHWKAKEGEITLLRFDECAGEYRVGCGEVETIPGPQNQNNYVWVRVQDWKRWERRLIYGPYPHHISGVYGRHLEVIREAVRYLPGVVLELFDG